MRDEEQLTINELIARLQKDPKDSAALQELFSSFYPMAVSFSLRRFPADSAGFDDAVEAMHIALYDAALSYDPEKGKFSTYAASCMRNRLIDLLRKSEKSDPDLLDPMGDEIAAIASDEDLERDLVGKETYLRALAAAKEILSPFQYHVLVLESEGYSTAEIAKRLGATPKRVDNAKYRTRTNKRIREIFSALL